MTRNAAAASSEEGSRVLAKLILLEQCCCDARMDASHMRTLAVIVDACYTKARCFIGPTAIGKIAGINEKTVRTAISGLQAAGYLDVEPRTNRSNWIIPRFAYAERVGALVTYKNKEIKVHRPYRAPTYEQAIAGAETRYRAQKGSAIAGVRAPASGSTGPRKRVPTPDEAVIETVNEAVQPFDDAKQQSQNHEKRHQRTEQQERESFRTEYVRSLNSHPKHARMMETIPTIRKHIDDLIDAAHDNLPPMVA